MLASLSDLRAMHVFDYCYGTRPSAVLDVVLSSYIVPAAVPRVLCLQCPRHAAKA